MKTTVEVIREALLKPVPCPTCSSTKPCRCLVNRTVRIDVQAAMIAADLTNEGLLPAPAPGGPTLADLEEVAQFLAMESRFVRYYDEDDPNDEGWRVLLTSPTDIDVAVAKAKARNEGDKAVTEAIVRGRRLLLDHCAQRRAAQREV